MRDILPVSLPASSDGVLEIINRHFLVAKVSCLNLCVDLKKPTNGVTKWPSFMSMRTSHLDSRVCWDQVLGYLVSLVNGNARANNGIVFEVRH